MPIKASEKQSKMNTCHGCSYYELDILGICPFEYCYKHDLVNEKPCDFRRCSDYTTDKWVAFKVWIKSISRIFR